MKLEIEIQFDIHHHAATDMDSYNPGIHEGFSELSGYYIFMIKSQWWISGGGIPVHSCLS